LTAADLAHHYTTRIENIPMSPITPPHVPVEPGFDDDFDNMSANGARANGHERDRRFNSSAEDVAGEFEREMLQDSPAPKGKKRLDAKKRPVPSHASDGEGSVKWKGNGDPTGPSAKRRKLDIESTGGANGVEYIPGPESVSLKLKLKGKAKQNQREPSHDSISATPKQRKKLGPRKKGLAQELENELGSRPSSVLGDVTPAVSRPTSPVPVNTTMVYDFDEPIPPIKRAKKVDDTAMIKRIRSLEEAQRKVWTNIARRDVVKASLFL
jgi:DNA helicase INO80